jgi:hypothetical protein
MQMAMRMSDMTTASGKQSTITVSCTVNTENKTVFVQANSNNRKSDGSEGVIKDKTYSYTTDPAEVIDQIQTDFGITVIIA